MYFTEHKQSAKTLIRYYAQQLHCTLALNIISGQSSLQSYEEAVELANFFWEMTDCAVEDHNADKVIDGIADLEHWMEAVLNIFMGYFKCKGFEDVWRASHARYYSCD